MASPTRQKPNKVLGIRVTAIRELDVWPFADFPGDPYWQGGPRPKPYRWEVDLTCNTQIHGDPSTRQPYQYNGRDIYVGDWVADNDRGRSLKVMSVLSKDPDTATIILEDVDRYNIFLDENGTGIFPAPGDAILFEINDMRMPILNPLPTDFADFTFSQEVMGRFQNNNPLFRSRVFQESHGLSDNESIWVDPVDGLFKTVTDDDELKVMVGTVDRAGPGEDIFYFIPTTKIVEGIQPALPGAAGVIIYVNPLTGEFSLIPGPSDKAAYIQLTNASSDTTVSTDTLVFATDVLGINNVPVQMTGTTLGSVVTAVNSTTALHSVSAQVIPGINEAVSNPVDQVYNATVAIIGLTSTATINGTLVSFDDATFGFVEFGGNYPNAEDMAASINAAAISNITAIGFGALQLIIQESSGGAITIVNGANDDNGNPFSGPASTSGVPSSTPAGGDDFIEFTNAQGSGIIFSNLTGTPVFGLGLTSVRNGELPKGLVVEQTVTGGGAGTGVAVFATLPELPGSGTVGDLAYVIDSDDGAGSDVGEWTFFIWDGFGWVIVATEDSAAVDARSLRVLLDDTSPATTDIGIISTDRRVSEVIVEVITLFDGSPTLNIGDASDADSLMSNDLIDLSQPGTYTTHPDFIYSTGSDTTVLASFTAGGATVGNVKVIITYV